MESNEMGFDSLMQLKWANPLNLKNVYWSSEEITNFFLVLQPLAYNM